MQILTEQSGKLSRPSVVTIGKFDGFHAGHRKLLSAVFEEKTKDLDTCVVSVFEEGAFAQQIYTREERLFLCENMGIDYLAEYELVPELKKMEPERFLKEYIVDRLCAGVIVVGEDFRFGNDRRGDAALLQELQDTFSFRLVVVPEVAMEGEKVSSTRIRRLLQEGSIEKANSLLLRQYMLLGEIVHGKRLGTTLGMPTINLQPSTKKALPAFGVYATKVKAGGFWYYGVTNIGRRPTTDGEDAPVSVETNLLGCNEVLYGKTAQIYFLKFLRPEQKFASITALQEAMERDRRVVEELFHVKVCG